jgi:hypothetical protein
MRDAFHFKPAVFSNIESGIAIIFSSLLPKINISGKFTEKQNIRTFQDFRFDAGCFQQFIK